MYWLAILMEPTVTEEVFKEIDECQVSLLLCLIDGATSVLLLNVLCIMEWITVFLIALVQVFLPEPLPH